MFTSFSDFFSEYNNFRPKSEDFKEDSLIMEGDSIPIRKRKEALSLTQNDYVDTVIIGK